jgi:hypothetical protein
VRKIRNLVKFLLAKASLQVEEEEKKTGEASSSDSVDFLRQLFEETTGISSSFLTETMLPTVTGMIAMLPDPNTKVVGAKIIFEYGQALMKEAYRSTARMIVSALPAGEVSLLDTDVLAMYVDVQKSNFV